MAASSYTHRLNADQLRQAREWIADCIWMEASEDLARLSDTAVERGIAKHYDGGIDGFIADGEPLPMEGGCSSS